ncbi:MFS transporter [Rhizobium sp. VS19-DR104.2]|uniref:MFS transporter n=1 Tax=unclassified Rhizobium TaxID=2613769 RepID=UPI001C5B4078|nr:MULTISPECIES: MFS transporter [unclassified Rhizobium]MBZ5763755.1 MFS transporter [Rhizobium sp. VS19-DR96]MBZ5769688.1 MFS transporter [Rhizobium sp. VS19-DR129.2]MBZ5777243.1 MFS transporter [Rhizobium sp. VS19-DRK62.2]MBZ5788361.1 MFS transporter [Rhizobium sp. VS19-DR121]MBZ5805808.1 MFS transporter [Rhizobium sp. VS19-DR181]
MFRPRLVADTGRVPLFWFLAAVFSVSVGRNSYSLACSWLLVASGHGTLPVAIFFAATCVVELAASPIAGWLCDRYDRRTVSIASDLLRLVGALVLASVIMTTDVFWAIVLSVIVFGVCDRLSLTATQSMIPAFTAGRSRAKTNSAVFVFLQCGGLVAAVAIGLLLHAWPSWITLVFIACCFCLSCVCMVAVPEEGRVVRPHFTVEGSMPLDATLLRLAGIYALLNAGGLLISVIGPSFVFQEHLGNALDFGHLEGAWSAGSILGVLLLVPIARATSLSSLHLMVLVVMAGLFAATAFLTFSWSVLVIAILGATYNLGRVSVEVALQACVSREALGRAKGLMHSVAVAFGLLLFVIVSFLSSNVRPSTVFLIFAAFVVLSTGLLAKLPPHRSKH